jgi:hypothetical protein
MKMDIWKKVPKQLNHRSDLFNVVTIKAYPPGDHYHSPIRNELFCVACTLYNGAIRYFGTTAAKIGADLRMHMVVSSLSEIFSSWEDSNLTVLGKLGETDAT